MKIFKAICFTLIFMITGLADVYAVENPSEHTILIDPGHGGPDGGASGINGVIEKGINLDISLKLRDALKDKGYVVHMTREDDNALSQKKREDLELRCNKKKEVNCDVFISIHQNKFNKSSCKGAQVWHASDEKSKNLAEAIQTSIKNNLDSNNKRVAKDAKKAYKILRDEHNGANVIVECGFLSNAEDQNNLQNDDYQQKLVDSIIKGLEDYYDKKAIIN